MKLRSVATFLLGTLAAFLIGVALFNYVVMPLLVHQYNTVVVPDLKGRSKKQGEDILRSLSLSLYVARSEYDNDMPRGYILSQEPVPGEKVREGRRVVVVVSLGAKMQPVPPLAGLSLRQARIMLRREGLTVGRVARVMSSGDVGERVMASFPAEGRELIEGSKVDILVQVGGARRSYMMPDLQGQDLLFVREKLEAMGFRVGKVTYRYRRGAFPNTIIAQKPGPGARIREGDSIELVAATTD